MIPYLLKWTKQHPNGLIFLQEVSERNQKRIEIDLGLQCEGTSYHPAEKCRNRNKETCPGLAVCSSKSWTFRRARHNDFPDHRNYGFFQTELKPQQSDSYFNAFN